MDNNMEKLRQMGSEQRERFQQANAMLPPKEPIAPAAGPPASEPEAGADRAAANPRSTSGIVRDTFSMPPADNDLIDTLRARAARHGRIRYRSEIVRAALRSLAALDEVNMIAAVDAVERVEQGNRTRKKG